MKFESSNLNLDILLLMVLISGIEHWDINYYYFETSTEFTESMKLLRVFVYSRCSSSKVNAMLLV
jgi:hypothetical protein